MNTNNINVTKPNYDDIQSTVLLRHGRSYTHNLFFRFKRDEESRKKIKLWLRDFVVKEITTVTSQLDSYLAGRKINRREQRKILNKKILEIEQELKNLIETEDLPNKLLAKENELKNIGKNKDLYKELQIEIKELNKKLELLDGKIIVNCFFSHQAIEFLNDDHQILPPIDAAFKRGMTSEETRVKLRDTQLKYWSEDYGGVKDKEGNFIEKAPLDLLIVVAGDADDPESVYLHASSESIKNNAPIDALIEENLNEILIEKGGNLRNSDDESIEPFGYRDGISQPVFINEKGELIEATKDIILYPEGDNHFGSFLVYRKLEQDVDQFNMEINKIARFIESSNKNRKPKNYDKAKTIKDLKKQIGAQIIGRHKDGTPLTQFQYPANQSRTPQRVNIRKFHYKASDRGQKCPYFSHIRQMNPRLNNKDITPQISRMGIPYTQNVGPFKKKGLLFMCFQKSIVDQFEAIQIRANGAENETVAGTPLDPLIGQTTTGSPGKSQSWNKAYDKRGFTTPKIKISELVRLVGGEYFYAPSIYMLGQLTKIKENPV